MSFVFAASLSFLVASHGAEPCRSVLANIPSNPIEFIRSIHIESERLTIRAVEDKDVRRLHHIIKEPSVRRYFFYGNQRLAEIGDQDLSRVREYFEQEGLLTIEERETGEVIGFVDLWDVQDAGGKVSVEVAWAFDESRQGRGYATETNESVARHLFHERRFDKLIGNARASNQRSIKMLLRHGYVQASEEEPIPTEFNPHDSMARRLKGTSLEHVTEMKGFDPAFVWQPDRSGYVRFELSRDDFLPRLFRPLEGLRIFDREWTRASVAELIDLTPHERTDLFARLPELESAVKGLADSVSPHKVVSGLFKKADSEPGQFYVAGIFLDAADPSKSLGLWMFRLDPNKGESFMDYIKIDRRIPGTEGLFKQWFAGYTNLLKRLGIRVDRLSAEWTGRLVWARMGYQIDPDYSYTIDGQKLSQTEGILQNFGRFLQEEGLSFDDLIVDWGDGRKTALKKADLQDVSVYAKVKHREGKKVQIAPYVDFMRFDLQRREHDVGIAFSSGFYGPRLQEPVRFLSPGGNSLGSSFMPGWRGIRKLPPREPPPAQ